MDDWHQDHPDYRHQEYERNKDTYRASRAAWLALPENAERKRELDRIWRQENPERKRANDQAYYVANRDRIAEEVARRYREDAEYRQVTKARVKRWQRANAERVRAKWAEWHAGTCQAR
jgi:hypothetical protein